MPQTRTVTVYQFDELSEKAKERARDWFREASINDLWWDATYDDAVECAKILGIEINSKNQPWVNTGTGKSGVDTSPAIFFSGFSSQGDGACFEGSYAYAKGAHKKIRQHAPKDENLHQIADGLLALQRSHSYRLTASVKHSGAYSHEHCTTIDVDGFTESELGSKWAESEKTLAELLRSFMRWIYRQLETEYDYQNADSQVDGNIRGNDYEFNEDGTRARIGK